jgi:hypothetical protein
MPTEEDLLQRIRELEAENSELRDKLDMIYAIVAPEEPDAADEDESGELIQIRPVN